MEDKQLINLITKIVIERLSKNKLGLYFYYNKLKEDKYLLVKERFKDIFIESVNIIEFESNINKIEILILQDLTLEIKSKLLNLYLDNEFLKFIFKYLAEDKVLYYIQDENFNIKNKLLDFKIKNLNKEFFKLFKVKKLNFIDKDKDLDKKVKTFNFVSVSELDNLQSNIIYLTKGAIITPLAKEIAKERGIKIVYDYS